MKSFQQDGTAQANIILDARDLSPGDSRCATVNLAGIRFTRVRSADSPFFSPAYDFLWKEFGKQDEIEQRDVLARRFAWKPEKPHQDYAMLYEMIVVHADHHLIAVRDHSAIVPLGNPSAGAIVHLSHALIALPWRRTGVGGWLRALPVSAGRECLARAGIASKSPITLVAEMEPMDTQNPDRAFRMASYEKAGFLKVDPAALGYLQPDFRPSPTIDATGGPRPLEMNLMLRRADVDLGPSLPGAEIRGIVDAIYAMYEREFRALDVASARSRIQPLPEPDQEVQLLPPTTT